MYAQKYSLDIVPPSTAMPAPLTTQCLEILNTLLVRSHEASSASGGPQISEPTTVVTDVSGDDLNNI